ncbi:hypothetical protein ACIPUO_16370 [Pectobacterium carotovorum]|uniref:hypothetical protein n=1 Tax=Pectobacterium carotovorum TaxID=554 RepID=UPI003800A98C
MSNENKFDDNNIYSIKNDIFGKYVELSRMTNFTYNENLFEDRRESLFVCLSASFFNFYYRNKSNLNKNARYNIHFLNKKLLDDDSFERLKASTKGEIPAEVMNEFIKNILNIYVEVSFWSGVNYIDEFIGSDKSHVDYICSFFLPESNIDYESYKIDFFFKSAKFFLDGKKIDTAYDLVIKNEKVVNDLASQINRAKSLQREVGKLERVLNDLESTAQVNILTKAFVKIKDRILCQLTAANKKYDKLMQRAIYAPLVVLSISIIIHVIAPVIMKAFAWTHYDYYMQLVSFNLLSAIFYSLPIIAFEMVLFYFSRVAYIEVKSFKTQLVQIEHRIASCEFIRNYMKQKNEHFDKVIRLSNNEMAKKIFIDGDSIGKIIGFPSDFEKLIFNPIQMNSDNIPAVLDGVSSIAELAGKVMSAKKLS